MILFFGFFCFGSYAQKVTTFDTPGTTTFTVPEGVTSIEYLVIAGGGGGGAWRGGGGGAGGVQEGTLSVTPGTDLTVTVGAGGEGATGGTASTLAANGQNSVFGSILATGGGGGGIGENRNNEGADGGSGGGEGGASSNGPLGPGLPVVGQGSAGGNSFNDLSDLPRAGGGGGGAGTGNTSGNAQDGEANSGGGGGGAGGGFRSVFAGGDGGSGVVILSYTLDTDGDGIPDENDYDNDGIADLNEGSTCYITKAISGVTTELTSLNDIATLYDGILTQENFFFGNNQAYPGSPTEIFNISFTEPLVITELKVLLNTDDLTNTQNNSFLGNNVAYQIQGFNGTSWDLLGSGTSDGVVSGEQEVFDLSANTTAYNNYRILWVGGGEILWDPWIEEILFKVAPCSETSLDSDNDGVADYLDLDSDNDGILDADEILNGQLSYEFYDSVPTGDSVDNIPTTTPDFAGNVSDFNVTSLSTSLTGNAETFSVRYKGSINIATAGTYRFYTSSDDGSKLFINGVGVVDNDGDHAIVEESGTIDLNAGVHSIEILFYENAGDEILSVSYESTTIPITKTLLPFSMLSSDLDSDSDGVPNRLDLDSDNDGCSDANEYYFSGIADGNSNGDDDLEYGTSSSLTVDADGRVEQADYNGTTYADAIDNSITEACNACNPVASGNTDTDGDGIADLCDLDADNDGILNEDECGIPKQKEIFSYTGIDQTYTIPDGASHIRAKIWGAGGRGDETNNRGVGGAGGFTEVLIPVSSLTSTTLTVTVGQGGDSSTGSNTYGNGGAGNAENGRNAGAGGGMSALTYRTLAVPGDVAISDLIAIAGGGTASSFNDAGSNAGEGGGLSGGGSTGGNPLDGQGGDQYSGGGSSGGNSGGFLVGGNAVYNGGAGGGGFYGGGSGAQTDTNIGENGGGGGSGYISVTGAIVGQTIRGSVQTPPRTTDSDYVPGVGTGGNFNAVNGGNGLIIIEALFFDCNTDGDGTPNYLDLDSDGDGCSDANEYYNNVSADGGDDGVYGIGTPAVDADGLVLDAGYNGSGHSEAIDETASICKDTDNDGIVDSIDLDSDNDGILNEDECGIDKQIDVFNYTGNDQTYTIPAEATHIRAKIWGAGGRGDETNNRGVGGAGGFTEVLIPVSSLTITSLVVTVEQGGDSSTGSRTYGNGGAGDSDGPRNFGSGGGMSALTYASLSNPASVSISDLIAIAGGGGTSPAFTNSGSHAGEGGGLSGGDADSGSASINGLGGDQNSGGGSPPNGNPGGYLVGGNAVLNGGAGGGGYYGGGSGTIASNNEGSGGGGSGYISIISTIDGQTIRGTIQTPPRTTDPDYLAGVGTGGNNGAGNGGNGLVVIEALFLDCDTDGDGILNYLDTDSDNDGIYDVLEADPTFTGTISAEGRISGTTTNGVPDAANTGNGFTPVDTDADLTLNFMDLNSDGDACPDANEYYNNPSADGGDNGIYGTGVPTLASATVTPAGLVVEAGYNGTGLANVTNASISSGCEPYIFEGSAGDVGLGGTWETQANWNFNRLPTAIDTAVVRANSNVTITQEVGELTVDAPYTVFIDTLQTLHIKENLTNKGDFRGQGFVVFDGTAAQQIIGNGAATDPDAGSFEHIRVNNSAGVTLTDNADLIHILDLNLGTFTIAADKFLTFKSTEVQTAVLTEVGKGGSAGISGCVVVERYIQQNKRAFRYIASAVNTNTTCGKASINANLQEGNQVTDYTKYPESVQTPGFGTHITGPLTDAMGNNTGFDATQTGNYSMFTWNEASSPQRWDAIPNTTNTTLTGSNTLDIGQSYALMIRGGRELNLNVNNNVASQDPTTLRFTGELVTGNIPVNNLASGNGKFSLVANPYQSQVDIEQLLSDADLLDVKREAVYIYDPNIGLRGGYAVLDLAGPDFDPVPNGSRATKFLQPNQSMFVENTGLSPSLTFKEIYKKNSNHGFTNGTFSVDNTASLNITLKRNDNSDVIVVDGVRLYFKESFDNAIQNNDALKFWNSDESFAIRHKDKYLSIERRKYPAPEETVQFNLFNYKNAAYQLEMDVQDFEKTVYLKDNYTGDLQKLENNAVTTYAFTANKQIPGSVSITRFELKFEQETLGVEDMSTKDISVYPNPASEILHIQLPSHSGKNASLQLMDMAGRLIFTETVNVENGRISTRNIENLGSGVYLINIEVDDKKYTKKIIIK